MRYLVTALHKVETTVEATHISLAEAEARILCDRSKLTLCSVELDVDALIKADMPVIELQGEHL
jgi:hypothetical protein